MIVFISDITNKTEAAAAKQLGADILCINPTLPRARQKGTVSLREAAKIAHFMAPVPILTEGFGDDPGLYMELGSLSPDIVKLSAQYRTNANFYRVFKMSAPDVKIMQTVSAAAPGDIELAVQLAWHCDYLFLQNSNPAIAKQIIMAVGVPVVIEGTGLDAEVIKQLDPYGVQLSLQSDKQALCDLCAAIHLL